VVSGITPDGKFVEIAELPDHPWFVAVQYHPGVQVAPARSAPALQGLRAREPETTAPPRGRLVRAEAAAQRS
jgi:CTP synthase (UTP-ammonia lyase)